MTAIAERVLAPNALFALQFVHDARLPPDGRRIAQNEALLEWFERHL